MKVSDYVAEFLATQGIRHVFAISGGASLHLIHSIHKAENITFVCPQHEQAGAMAADAYARVTGNLGAALATSGPGATNLITGVCGAFYDSVPTIFITGQVARFRSKEGLGIRQMGFQETDTIDIYRSFTKYAVLVNEPVRIRYELEKAIYLARLGRPGPVLVDIPDDVQREQVDHREMEAYVPQDLQEGHSDLLTDLAEKIDRCLDLISKAERPVVILGWGIRLAGAEEEVMRFVERLGLPVVPTWAVADLLPAEHPLLIGTFGTHGTRYANFAVQNSDLILSIGSRLDTKATGSPASTFARGAKKIMVDIDGNEIDKFCKFGLHIDLSINEDALIFLRQINKRVARMPRPVISAWLDQICEWKRLYPICPDAYYEEVPINPYVFVRSISEACEEGDIIITDTGCSVAWLMQAFEFKKGQRFFHDWNNTAMGWALPASIGASLALDGKRIICVTGDGSLQMNIQELATVVRHQLPVKILLVNNHGHSMVQQTQEQWFDGEYLATTVEGGLGFPDFAKLAAAYGVETVHIEKNADLQNHIRKAFAIPGPVLCNVEIAAEHRVIPQVKFGRPNEDLGPLLTRDDFLKQMIIDPLEVSQELE